MRTCPCRPVPLRVAALGGTLVALVACGSGPSAPPLPLGEVDVVLGSSLALARTTVGEGRLPLASSRLAEGPVVGQLDRAQTRTAAVVTRGGATMVDVVGDDRVVLARVPGRFAALARDGRVLFTSRTATEGLARVALPGSELEPLAADLGAPRVLVGEPGLVALGLGADGAVAAYALPLARPGTRVLLRDAVVALAVDPTAPRVALMTRDGELGCRLFLARITSASDGTFTASAEAVAQALACAAGDASAPPEQVAFGAEGEHLAFTVGATQLVSTALVDLPLDARLPLAPLWTAPRPIRALRFTPAGELLLATVDRASGPGADLVGLRVGSGLAVGLATFAATVDLIPLSR
jgi:hypothetical protein